MAAITTPGGAYHHELRQNIARLAQDEQPKSGVLVRETEYISGNDTADGSIHWKTGFMARSAPPITQVGVPIDMVRGQVPLGRLRFVVCHACVHCHVSCNFEDIAYKTSRCLAR